MKLGECQDYGAVLRSPVYRYVGGHGGKVTQQRITPFDTPPEQHSGSKVG